MTLEASEWKRLSKQVILDRGHGCLQFQIRLARSLATLLKLTSRYFL